MSVVRVILFDLCTKFEVCRSPLGKIRYILPLSINRPSMTLTFRPLNWDTGPRFMGFLPVSFQLPMPLHSRLSVRHGTDRQTHRQTDKQMTAINLYFPHPMGHFHHPMSGSVSEWLGRWTCDQ